MTLTWARNRRLNRSFLISLAIHACAAMLFPAMLVMNSGNTSVETISFAKLMRIHFVAPQPIEHRPVAVAPLKAPVVHVTHANLATHESPSNARSSSKSTSSSQAPTVGAVAKAGIAVQASSVPAVAATAAAPAAVPAPSQSAGGNYGFGVEQPVPVLNQSVFAQLKALSVHTTLVVTVDADGHTKNIVFKTAVDPDIEARIRALLASASWDAATCGGGIGCEADATITL